MCRPFDRWLNMWPDFIWISIVIFICTKVYVILSRSTMSWATEINYAFIDRDYNFFVTQVSFPNDVAKMNFKMWWACFLIQFGYNIIVWLMFRKMRNRLKTKVGTVKRRVVFNSLRLHHNIVAVTKNCWLCAVYWNHWFLLLGGNNKKKNNNSIMWNQSLALYTMWSLFMYCHTCDFIHELQHVSRGVSQHYISVFI